MKTNVRRWLPGIVHNHARSALLGLAAVAAIGAAVATGAAHQASTTAAGSPVAASIGADDRGALVKAADKASERPAAAAGADEPAADKAAADRNAATKAAADKAAKEKAAAEAALRTPRAQQFINVDVQLQPNYFYCGPAATRIALSAQGRAPSQDALAGMLGTTTDGTASAIDITRVLNSQLGQGRYHTSEIRSQAATKADIDLLEQNLIVAINRFDPVVANVAGTVTDTDGQVHSYNGGHYLTVIGYTDKGRMAVIADPADTVGKPTYELSTIDLANWMATRGYSS